MINLEHLSFFLLDDELLKKTGIFINILKFFYKNEFDSKIGQVIMVINELKNMDMIIQYQFYLRNVEMNECEIPYLLKCNLKYNKKILRESE